jgi:segregation and condensation protein A
VYRVELDTFEGPLDLLLFFVRRDELDLRDIPIARIADEYLAYVRLLEQVDLDGAADFIYLAAELIAIKAAMLLPRPATADGEEVEDPRLPLVERLLEYVRYKEAAGLLDERWDERARHATRGAASDERERLAPPEAEPALKVSLFDLVRALQRALAQAPEPEPTHALRSEAWTVEAQAEWLLAEAGGRRRSFVELVGGRPRGFVIATFLAVLELVRRQTLRLVLGAGADDFAVEAAAPPPGDAPEGDGRAA